MAGIYEFANSMCDNNEGSSSVCINRDVTIEAEVAGSVVLDAKGARRVIYVSSGGRAELIGLNITGGSAFRVCFCITLHRSFASPLTNPAEFTDRCYRCYACSVAGGFSRESNLRVTFHCSVAPLVC